MLRMALDQRKLSTTDVVFVPATRKSTGNLVGDNLPQHTHGNQLMEKIDKETEKKVGTIKIKTC